MPRKRNPIPSYRKHSSGQARVTINSRDYLLGPYGSDESKQRYSRLIDEWQANVAPAAFGQGSRLLVSELVIAYAEFARAKYGDGKGSEAVRLKPVLRIVNELFGELPAVEFKRSHLRQVRQRMIDEDLSLDYVNKQMQRVIRMFRWAVDEEELLPAETPVPRLKALQPGEFSVRVADDIEPVPEDVVDRTLAVLPEVVADMVRFQLLTGCRPGEACKLTPGMIDRSGKVWEAKLKEHKTRHRGKERIILIGPKAQDVIRPYLLRADDDCLFRPCDSERKRREAMTRTTPTNQGNRQGYSKRTRNGDAPKRQPGVKYTPDTYRQAVQQACERHGIPKWFPNQLRHTRATIIRKDFGLDVAGAVLGHSHLDVTQIYAQQNMQKATAAVLEIG